MLVKLICFELNFPLNWMDAQKLRLLAFFSILFHLNTHVERNALHCIVAAPVRYFVLECYRILWTISHSKHTLRMYRWKYSYSWLCCYCCVCGTFPLIAFHSNSFNLNHILGRSETTDAVFSTVIYRMPKRKGENEKKWTKFFGLNFISAFQHTERHGRWHKLNECTYVCICAGKKVDKICLSIVWREALYWDFCAPLTHTHTQAEI